MRLVPLALAALFAGPSWADPPPRPATPPTPGFTTGRTPGFTTGRMPGFTTGPISDPRAGYPVCSVDIPCVMVVDESEAFDETQPVDDETQPVDDEVGTLPGDEGQLDE